MRASHRSLKRAAKVAVLTAGVLAVVGVGAASAQADPPPQLGDPVGANTSPHGGYSSSSNFCLQCHTMHGAEGSYILMAETSVTDTCKTCHGLEGSAAGDGARTGTGTASSRPAYTLPEGAAASGHAVGATEIPGETLNITDSKGGKSPGTATRTGKARAGASGVEEGGLYCASCHTPHGDFGHLVNDWDPEVDENKELVFGGGPSAIRRRLDWDGTAGAWRWCTPGEGAVVMGDGANTGCPWATLEDARGEPASAYGYKLLSAAPNHTYANATKNYATGNDIRDWCSTCHVSKPRTYSTTNHGSNCASCHGPADDGTGDYPHTSSEVKLLQDASDALCINCHTDRLS